MAPLLDKNKNNCIKYSCGFGRIFRGVVTEGGIRRTIHSRMECKRWSCPDCGPKQAWILQQLIAAKAKELGLFRMLTLTLDPKKIKGEAYTHLNESWRKLREAFRRKFKASISFIAVNEYQKNGMPHKHVLVDRYIHQKWVKNKWKKLGGGHQVDIRRIKNEDDPARYICKYLTKDVLINAPKGRKRVTTSRDIKLREKVDTGEWELVEAELDDIFERQKDRIAAVVTNKDGRIRSIEEHESVDAYEQRMSNGELEDEWDYPEKVILPFNPPKPGRAYYDILSRTYRKLEADGESENESNGDLLQGVEQGTVG